MSNLLVSNLAYQFNKIKLTKVYSTSLPKYFLAKLTRLVTRISNLINSAKKQTY